MSLTAGFFFRDARYLYLTFVRKVSLRLTIHQKLLPCIEDCYYTNLQTKFITSPQSKEKERAESSVLNQILYPSHNPFASPSSSSSKTTYHIKAPTPKARNGSPPLPRLPPQQQQQQPLPLSACHAHAEPKRFLSSHRSDHQTRAPTGIGLQLLLRHNLEHRHRERLFPAQNAARVGATLVSIAIYYSS